MSEVSTIISHCPACQKAMDITALAPFTRVACPNCGENTRVKLEFGPYVLERRLSTGGMSVLFVGRDTLLDREVAVKILNEEYSKDERRIEAFEEEARVTASLSHPNIVRVLTTGRAFGRFFIAMELVPGGHFEHHIRKEGRIEEARVLKLAIQIASGLKAAHEANLIHRDIKPGNILLDAEGNAKIVDFGLALVTQGGTARAKEFWATPYYVPPETIEGAEEDFRADIYAFGATLYHALAGKPPCDEESMSVHLLRAAKKNIVPLHIAHPDLSMAVCEIVEKAMAYHPEDRFASYDELLAALQDAANRTKHGLARESAGEVTSRRSRKRRTKHIALASAGLAAGLTLVSALAWLVRQNGGGGTNGDAQQPTLAENTDANGTSDAAALAAKYEEAREAFQNRAFVTAVDRFDRLFNHPDLMEPTRTWAGVQALVAAMMDGDGTRARQMSEALKAHVERTDAGDPGIADNLKIHFRGLAENETLNFRYGRPTGGGAPELAAWIIVGIHNWQAGRHDQAAEFFREALEIPIEGDGQWFSIFHDVAREHLEDHALLNDPSYGSEPRDVEEATAILERLQEMRGSVRTQGEVSELLRRDIVRISNLRSRLEDEPADPPQQETDPSSEPEDHDPFADVFPPSTPPVERVSREDVRELISAYRLRDALELMPDLDEDEVPPLPRNAWTHVTSAAATFLEMLAEDVNNRRIPINRLQLKNGDIVVGIGAHPDGSPADADGNPIAWSEIHMDSLIEWHRERVKDFRHEDLVDAHEAAIAMDFLLGNRERALGAIRNMTNEVFRRNWEIILRDFPH